MLLEADPHDHGRDGKHQPYLMRKCTYAWLYMKQQMFDWCCGRSGIHARDIKHASTLFWISTLFHKGFVASSIIQMILYQ